MSSFQQKIMRHGNKHEKCDSGGKKQAMETIFEGAQLLILSNTYFIIVIINMF